MGLSKAALSALKRLTELKEEFMAARAREQAYLQATKDLPIEQVPSQEEWWQSLPTQKVLQGVYRGYAGDGSAMTAEGPLFVANQKQMADAFAQRRAGQTAQEPHVEMFLMDPFENYEGRYRIHPREAKDMSVVRKVDPRALSGRSQLYARGGLTQVKECACGH